MVRSKLFWHPNRKYNDKTDPKTYWRNFCRPDDFIPHHTPPIQTLNFHMCPSHTDGELSTPQRCWESSTTRSRCFWLPPNLTKFGQDPPNRPHHISPLFPNWYINSLLSTNNPPSSIKSTKHYKSSTPQQNNTSSKTRQLYQSPFSHHANIILTHYTYTFK